MRRPLRMFDRSARTSEALNAGKHDNEPTLDRVRIHAKFCIARRPLRRRRFLAETAQFVALR